MNQKDFSLIEKMRITSDAVVVNQCGRDETIVFPKNGKTIKWINSSTSGLSISRNICLKNATADICLLADDDLEYVDGYETIVSKAFVDYAEADIIRFKAEGIEKEFKHYPDKPKRIGFFNSLKSSSVELAFRRSSLSGIRFDELIGAGTKYCMGEENAFLVHCLRSNAKMMFLPETISRLHFGTSSWRNITTEQYLISRGASFEAMGTHLIHALILQFAVRKRYLYRESFSIAEAIQLMYRGRRCYQNDKSNTRRVSTASFNDNSSLPINDPIKEHLYTCPNYKKNTKEDCPSIELMNDIFDR
ncbi:MAG: glycosyltransferase family 2 protein [Mogibacterium sp.]|nr:glycosyltransferase family 2 protein [Mogibacterium sp.]